MGNSIVKSIFHTWFPKDVRILIVGLDSAGKTTLLYKMKLGEVVQAVPTIGFNVETVQYKNINITAWDVGGRGNGIRGLWKQYNQNVHAVMFVVDSTDRERIEEAKANIFHMIEDDKVGLPFLIYANKQDLPNAMKKYELEEKLELSNVKDREWYIEGSCMTNGDGIYEGLDWLTKAIERGFEKTSPSAKIEGGSITTTTATVATKRWWFF